MPYDPLNYDPFPKGPQNQIQPFGALRGPNAFGPSPLPRMPGSLPPMRAPMSPAGGYFVDPMPPLPQAPPTPPTPAQAAIQAFQALRPRSPNLQEPEQGGSLRQMRRDPKEFMGYLNYGF